MKRRRRNEGLEPPTLDVDLPRSKRRKLERSTKKARRQAHHVKGKSVIQKEMERICQKLNIVSKPAEVKEAAVKRYPKTLPTQQPRKEMERTRKQNLLRDNKEEDKVIKQLEKKLFLNKRKNKNMPRSFIDEGLDYILEITDQKYKDAALAKEAAQMGVDWMGSLQEPCKKLEARGKGAGKEHEKASGDEEDGASSESEADSNGEEVTDEEDVGADSMDKEENSEDDFLKQKRKEKTGRVRAPASDSDDEGSLSEEDSPTTTSTKVERSAAKNAAKKDKPKVRFDIPDDDKDSRNNGESCSEEDEKGEQGPRELCTDEEGKDGTWEDIYGRLRDEAGNVVAGKYVPPSKRVISAEPSVEKREELARLKRQLKGLLNRLSESTVQPIGSQIEELYQKFSNHDVNSTLLSSLCDVLIAPFLTPARLAMEHAMVVAYLHCNVASEVGAYVLENMVERFHSHYEHISNERSGKEADNCVLFISYLFAFKVVHSKLIFDIIQKLAASFGDRDVEMILLVLRSVGFGLRKHDPVALKEVVLLLQQKSIQDADTMQDSRKKFMLEVLMAIRNNNVQKIPNCDPSMVERASKILRGLCRKGHSMQELKISLEDLQNAKEKGKWWVVGSAWAGNRNDKSVGAVSTSAVAKTVFTGQIMELAKKHRMNTEIRKNIFCIIMTAEDYLDAGEKILRLNLSPAQEREVCYVILHCCMKEKQHNPYYAHLAKFFCKRDRKFYMTLQCAIWDKMKELENTSRSESSNLAQFMVLLLCQEVLSLSILKTVQFVDMSPSLVRFLRQLFLGLFEVEDGYRSVFLRVAEPPKLRLLREGVRLFLHQYLLDKTSDAALRKRLERTVGIADAALASVDDRNFY